jgi:hypothetical protein
LEKEERKDAQERFGPEVIPVHPLSIVDVGLSGESFLPRPILKL